MKTRFTLSLDFTPTERVILVILFTLAAYMFLVFNHDNMRLAEAHRSATDTGWHNGVFDSDGDTVTSTGVAGVYTEVGLPVNSAGAFIGWVSSRLSGGNYQDRVAAAFFVNTMLDIHRGAAYTTVAGGVAHAQANFGTWSQRVNDYQAAGRINWSLGMNIPAGFNNSFYQQAHGLDDAFYFSAAAEFMPVIVFYNPNGSTYMIKKNCGNPIGQIAPLAETPTFWDYDVDVSPSSGACQMVSPGLTFRVTSREVNNGDGAGPGHTHRIYAQAGSSRTNVANYATIIGGTGGGFNALGGRTWNVGGLGIGASSTRYVDYRLNLNAPDAIRMYFAADVRGAAGQATPSITTTDPVDTSNDGEGTVYTRCIEVDRREYNYEPSPPTAYSTQARFYSGYTYDISALVRNIGNGVGPNYTQRITMSPASILGDPYSQNYAGLGVGGSRTLDTRFSQRFTIPASMAHGSTVSCSNFVQPDTGLAPPSPITGLGTSQTVTNNNCLTVENRRFNVRTLSSADVLFNPTTVLPTQSFDVDVRVCNDGPLPAGAQPGTARRIQTTISPSTNAIGGVVVNTNDISYGGGGCIVYNTSWTVSNLAQLGQQACVRVQINRDMGFSEPAPNGFAVTGSQDYNQCIDVAEQAYIEVGGSSVWSGGNFDNPGNGGSITGYGTSWCAPSGTGRIETARLNGIGAWADYVAGATGLISNFGSEHINTGNAIGTGLTFANVGGSEGLFGQGRCITDLAQYLSTDTTRTNIRSLATGSSWPTADGQWIRSGDLTISGHTINAGDRFTIYVDGDVTITGDLVYGNYSVADKDLIPSLIIVATGDIDVQAAVENLHGLYFARGTIDTCSNQGAALSSLVCRNHLTIVGQFIADDVEFRRTFGGVSGGNPNGGTREAEEFLFSPELYLANPVLISDFTPQLRIDQLIDLPPVIN